MIEVGPLIPPANTDESATWLALLNRQYALINCEDLPRLIDRRWIVGRSRIHNGEISLTEAILGRPPRGHVWDHRSGDWYDNRRANLRPATAAQNAANRRAIASRNRSGFYGVMRDAGAGGVLKYRGVVCMEGTRHVTPWVPTAFLAAIARDALAWEIQGEFGVYNFPRSELLGAERRVIR